LCPGVPVVQDLAVGLHNHFVLNGIPSYGELEPFFNMILTPEQQVELAIRVTLKVELDGLKPNDDLKAMFDVLLGIVYPIFGDIHDKIGMERLNNCWWLQQTSKKNWRARHNVPN
jgi:hypothetical protein